MKHLKFILLALCCVFFTANALATSVTKDNAAKVAKNYLSEVLFSNGKNLTSAISESFEITKDGNTVFYVFNFEKGGYVMVSAEDRFAPIIGYSTTGHYDQNNVPDGLQFLMGEYSEIIAFIRENNIAGKPQYAEKWERYQSDNLQLDRNTAAVVVAPMTALWNQDSPYNFYAPDATGGPGGKAYAGCVATAMSIIMYYWRWPWQGTGEKSYNPYFAPPNDCPGLKAPSILTAKFGETYYDYNGMYGTPEVTADKLLYEPIALLQYHAGVAVSMMYCNTGSGAYSTNVPVSMRNYFKYDPTIHQVARTTTAAWTTMLKEQLDLKQPVYVSGRNAKNEGHAFVCDGYNSDDYMHYNFGWSGYHNGYYISDQPEEFLATSLAAIVNFIPDRTKGYPINANGTWTVPWMKGTISDCSGPVDFYEKGTTSKWLIDPASVGNATASITINHIEMNLAVGDYLRFYDGEDESAALLGEFTGSAAFSPITSSGGKVLVKFTSAADSPTAQGFLISYEAKAVQHCDPRSPITITNLEGIFTDGSPEDMNYNNGNGMCTWNIFPKDAIDSTEIELIFTRIDTEAGVDLIKILDLDKNKLITTISGKYLPTDTLPQYKIQTKRVRVTFFANDYINGKGFELQYKVTKVGIAELENVNNISIYPNPVKDMLSVVFNAEVADNFEITLFTITGQTIYKENLINFAGDYNKTLDMSGFSQGVYLMQIKSSKGVTTHKIVK